MLRVLLSNVDRYRIVDPLMWRMGNAIEPTARRTDELIVDAHVGN